MTSYTIDFKLYRGKSKMSSGKGLSFDIVTRLVNKHYLRSTRIDVPAYSRSL